MTPEAHETLLASATKSLRSLTRTERKKAKAALDALGAIVGTMIQPGKKDRPKFKKRRQD